MLLCKGEGTVERERESKREGARRSERTRENDLLAVIGVTMFQRKGKDCPAFPHFSLSLSPSPYSLPHSLSCSLLCVVLIILILNLLKLTNDIRRQHRRAASWEETGCPSSSVACRLSMGCFLELSVRERALWRLLINHTHLQHAATLWHVRLGNSCAWVLVSAGCWAWP